MKDHFHQNAQVVFTIEIKLTVALDIKTLEDFRHAAFDQTDGIDGVKRVMDGFAHLLGDAFGGQKILNFTFVQLADADKPFGDQPADEHVGLSQGKVQLLGKVALIGTEPLADDVDQLELALIEWFW